MNNKYTHTLKKSKIHIQRKKNKLQNQIPCASSINIRQQKTATVTNKKKKMKSLFAYKIHKIIR